ncbi:tether containing UBX domain for GLUT4 isoform X1 [Pelobates cultripes]|uniref:Tether containing UBX domain for GLUT4 isoform X1 n=1 Tax=Pelobates cultripes TaxID=61616 RepID=A0AAD1S5E0_PELCU|nr:tether containing UBX domain for GLUT4 isoform X1 [Pelobates cultripes]
MGNSGKVHLATVQMLAPNGRRQTVRVTAGTPLIQILEEVCKKQNFNPRDYDLKFQRTVLDLSMQWRFANLPNNAKLEMVSCTQQRTVAESTKVRIAFQLDEGVRLQHEFLSSQTFWDVICQFPESRPYLDLVTTGHFPVCIYMRDEVVGEQALRQTTLQSLGITGGSVIIRFLMRKNEKPVNTVAVDVQKDVAHEKSTLPKVIEGPTTTQKKVDKPAVHEEDKCPSDKLKNAISIAETVATVKSTEALFEEVSRSSLDSKEQQNVESGNTRDKQYPSCSHSTQFQPQTQAAPFIPFQGGGQRLGGATPSSLPSEPEMPRAAGQEPFRSPGPSKPKKSKTDVRNGDDQHIDREPVVCHLDLEENVNLTFQEPTDDFFEVTVDDVRRRFSELRSERHKLEESPLLTKAMRESQMKEKLERYPKVVLRVLFPDRYILQGFFHITETVGQVKEFVRSHLEETQLPFYLFITPPRTELKEESQTLFQADLFPAAVVHFGSQIPKDHYLCQELCQAPLPPSQADLIVVREIPRTSEAPASPVLENFTALTAEEVRKGHADSAVKEDYESPISQPQVPRDHGVVPKWLKLPGKK